MRTVAVYIRTSRQTQGRAYCERYPEKADDLWVVASARGRKERIHIGSPTPENHERAQQKKEEIESALHLVRSSTASVLKPTLASAAAEYLRRGMALHQLAASTQEDRCLILAEKGALLHRFGTLRLNSLRLEMLLDWWHDFVIDGKKSVRTGRNHLDALSGVYRYAMQRRIVNANPVDALRATLRALNRTKAARQEQDTVSKANPIDSIADLSRFVHVSANWNQTAPRKRRLTAHEVTLRGDAHIANLLLLDAGLRLGEAFALRWRHIRWGRDANDATRYLSVEEARARNTYVLAHAYHANSIANCIEAGVHSIEHGNLLDEETAQAMAKAGAFLVPTMVTYDVLEKFGDQLGLTKYQHEKIRLVAAGAQ